MVKQMKKRNSGFDKDVNQNNDVNVPHVIYNIVPHDNI